MKRKRYITYNSEIAKEICDELSTSIKGITELCYENPHWPTFKNVYRWMHAHEDFRQAYARAKAFQVELLVEEALKSAFRKDEDTIIDGNGNQKCDHEWVSRSRLKIDTIKWIACKLAPRVYGERIQVENTNPNDDPQIINARKVVHQLMQDKKDKYDGRPDAIENTSAE